jgi:threonine dehydrogenase-like Zn-dependent dehydrogenase
MIVPRLVCPAHGEVALVERELPDAPGPRQVLVRNTHGAEKHGTMEAFVHKHANKRGRWDNARRMHLPGDGVQWAHPIPLGNLQVGFVERVGSEVTQRRVGERLVFYRGFEPYSLLDENEGWPLPASVDWRAATLLDPAVYASCALRDAGVRLGDALAVFSLGAIGLCVVALAKLAGCHPIIAIDPVARRRAVAEQLGAEVVLDPTGLDVGARLRELTGWRGVDVVVEYSGTVAALNAALRGVAFGGTVACGAFPAPYGPGLDFGAEAHMNRPNIIFTRTESEPLRDHPNWTLERYRATALRLIGEGRLDGAAIVHPIVPFGPDLPERYRQAMADPASSIKLGVAYGGA